MYVCIYFCSVMFTRFGVYTHTRARTICVLFAIFLPRIIKLFIKRVAAMGQQRPDPPVNALLPVCYILFVFAFHYTNKLDKAPV